MPQILPQAPFILKEESLEFQKYVSDIEFFRQKVIYRTFCGWREEIKQDSQKFLGISSNDVSIITIIDPNNRTMNEKGGDYLLGKLYPLISAPATTSSTDADTIYEMLHGTAITIIFALLRDKRGKNQYEFDDNRIADVVAFVCSFKVIIQNSNKGYKFKEMRASYSTVATTPTQLGYPQPQKKEWFGIF
jgi:hypothetical protein